jgi:hypothetical protein
MMMLGFWFPFPFFSFFFISAKLIVLAVSSRTMPLRLVTLLFPRLSRHKFSFALRLEFTRVKKNKGGCVRLLEEKH